MSIISDLYDLELGFISSLPQFISDVRHCYCCCIIVKYIVYSSGSFHSVRFQIMVCNCKPPQNGGMGCRSQCLNRMLSIECIKGMCPCGELCSNQQVTCFFILCLDDNWCAPVKPLNAIYNKMLKLSKYHL
jgi:AWS domain